MPEALFAGSDLGNIGRQDIAQAAASPGLQSYGPQVGLVKFPGRIDDSELQARDPAVITASVYASPKDSNRISGPIIGIAIFGTGNGEMNEVEFDIPCTQQTTLNRTLSPLVGGTVISVVASSLEIRARNDAALILPQQGTTGNLPLGGFIDGSLQGNSPAMVSASLGIGTKGTSQGRVSRTVWAVICDDPDGLANNANCKVNIPPFATSFRVMRGALVRPAAAPIAQAPAIRFSIDPWWGPGNTDGGYNVGIGVPCPEIPLSGQHSSVTISNVSGGVINVVGVVFYLSL